MQRIQLKGSPISYSRLVYGVWRLADDSDHSVDHIRAKIDAALAEGITTFDHADIYGDYECEKLFGEALKADSGLRDKIEIVTKCDIALISEKYPNRRVKYYDTSATYINQSVENSLTHLGTDRLDTLLIHRPDPLMDAVETGAALDALIDSGKVLSVGVSNFKPDDWRLLQKHMSHPLAVNQIEISPLVRDAFTNGDLSALQLDEMTTMAWSPLAGGQLFTDNESATRVRPLLEKIANDQNARLDTVAFAWLLKHPANIVPVVGTNNLSRIQGLAKALEVEMDRESWFEIWTAAAGVEVP